MSGGSWDYLYSKVDDAADTLSGSTIPMRRAFGKHLKLVAEALHDIEWVDSCDYSAGDEEKAIAEVLGKDPDALALAEVVVEAKRIIKELEIAIQKTNATP